MLSSPAMDTVAHLSPVEVDELVTECLAITAAMSDSRDAHAMLAARRRVLLFRLNREGGLTYKDLRDRTGLAWSRLIEEVRKVREETGADRLPPGRRPLA